MATLQFPVIGHFEIFMFVKLAEALGLVILFAFNLFISLGYSHDKWNKWNTIMVTGVAP